MPKSAYEKVRDAMAPETKALSTPDLCVALLALDAPDLDEAGRIARAVMEDELCERHPEVDAASLRWSEDPVAVETHAEVVVLAALKAVGKSA